MNRESMALGFICGLALLGLLACSANVVPSAPTPAGVNPAAIAFITE